MDYKAIPFEQRIKENIRSYEINNLYALDTLTEYCKALCAVTDAAILLTERHGEKIISADLPLLSRMWWEIPGVRCGCMAEP